MHHISTIVNKNGSDGNGGGGDDRPSKRRTWAFVSGIMALYYPDISPDNIDGIKQTCIMYHSSISGFGEKEYNDRLAMIRRICEVPNMPGLYGRYRNAQDALRIACGELCNLQHDFNIVQPKNYSTGAVEEIKRKELEYKQEDLETSKQRIKELKGIFND